MRLPERLKESLGTDMGVDLSCLQRGMSEQLLDLAEIRSPIKEMRGRGMSQGVGREMINTGHQRSLIDNSTDLAGINALATNPDK